MDIREFTQWAKTVAKEHGYRLGACLSQGNFYKQDQVKNIIFALEGKDPMAVIKLYADYHINDEPISMKAFEEHNQSTKISNPKLISFDIESPTKGWLITERLPDDAYQWDSPLSQEEAADFVKIFREYKHHFPKTASRPLMMSEQLSAHEFHTMRIYRWFLFANEQEEQRRQQTIDSLLDRDTFTPLFEQALSCIRKEFSTRQMEWIHGHVKPQELFYSPSQDHYYLLDFAHTKMYPVGYEQGFIIWADVFMGDWNTSVHESYESFLAAIDTWKERLLPTLEQEENREALLCASLMERCMGTILADVTASDMMDRSLQEKKIEYLSTLLKELRMEYADLT